MGNLPNFLQLLFFIIFDLNFSISNSLSGFHFVFFVDYNNHVLLLYIFLLIIIVNFMLFMYRIFQLIKKIKLSLYITYTHCFLLRGWLDFRCR